MATKKKATKKVAKKAVAKKTTKKATSKKGCTTAARNLAKAKTASNRKQLVAASKGGKKLASKACKK